MHNKKIILNLTFIIVLLILSGCNIRQKASSTTLQKPLEADLIKKTEEKQDWELEWERALKSGKAEGKVVMFSTWRPEARLAIAHAFKAEHGIDLEYVLWPLSKMLPTLTPRRFS